MATANSSRKPKKRGGKRPGAGRPALPPGEVRECRVMLRFTAGELAELRRKANGEDVSVYVRRKVLA